MCVDRFLLLLPVDGDSLSTCVEMVWRSSASGPVPLLPMLEGPYSHVSSRVEMIMLHEIEN